MAVKRAWLITGSAMALTMVLVLPPRPAPDEPVSMLSTVIWFWRGVPGVYYRSNNRWELESARGGLRLRLERVARGDSILAAVRAGHGVRSADGALTVLYERPLSADSASRWLAALEREAALYPSVAHRGGQVVVVLYSPPDRAKLRNSAGEPPWGRRQWYAGAVEAPACIVEASLTSPRGWSPPRLLVRDSMGLQSRVLDACALFLRLGAPGPAVRDWVGAVQPAWWGRSAGLSDYLADARAGVRPTGLSGELSRTERACLRGATLYCEWLVGVRTPRGGRANWYWSGIAAERRRQLLAALLSYQEPGRFAAFWSSPDSVPQALARAYGRPAGDVVADWARTWSDVPVAGPGVQSRALYASLGWAVVLLAGALVATLRWRTD